MAFLDNMEVADSAGFQRRVQMAMFEKAKSMAAPSPTADDIAYIAGILNGEVSLRQMAIGVMLNVDVAAAGAGATDAEISTAIDEAWAFYAKAWVARAV